MPGTRSFYLCVLIITLGLLGFGLYLEHVKGLAPCPLCVIQRIAFIVIAVIALTGTLHGPGRIMHTVYSSLLAITALIGSGIAGRQVWLQHLPADQVPECGPSLDYMLEAFPLTEALKMILSGSGECAEVQWRFIGLSIAEWSLIWFVLILLASLVSIRYFRR